MTVEDGPASNQLISAEVTIVDQEDYVAAYAGISVSNLKYHEFFDRVGNKQKTFLSNVNHNKYKIKSNFVII